MGNTAPFIVVNGDNYTEQSVNVKRGGCKMLFPASRRPSGRGSGSWQSNPHFWPVTLPFAYGGERAHGPGGFFESCSFSPSTIWQKLFQVYNEVYPISYVSITHVGSRFVFRIAYCVLRITYCVLRIAYCVLRIAYCVLRGGNGGLRGGNGGLRGGNGGGRRADGVLRFILN